MSFEIIFILSLVFLQVVVFSNVLSKINAYKIFFPGSFEEIQIKKFLITKSILSDPELFDNYLDSLSNDVQIIEQSENVEEVELLVIPNSTQTNHSLHQA